MCVYALQYAISGKFSTSVSINLISHERGTAEIEKMRFYKLSIIVMDVYEMADTQRVSDQ